jgi:hypothetical protein
MIVACGCGGPRARVDVRRVRIVAAGLTWRTIAIEVAPRTISRGNLADLDAPAQGERFGLLARLGGTDIEHIVSSDAPDAAPYDQDHDEWVLLCAGTAVLEIAGERTALVAGDWLVLPARTPHRVLATGGGARWIAVHVR